MKIYRDESLANFDFWAGARERIRKLDSNDFDIIEKQLEELYPEGLSETEINDFFWFDFDTIAEWLGYDDEEDFDQQRKN